MTLGNTRNSDANSRASQLYLTYTVILRLLITTCIYAVLAHSNTQKPDQTKTVNKKISTKNTYNALYEREPHCFQWQGTYGAYDVDCTSRPIPWRISTRNYKSNYVHLSTHIQTDLGDCMSIRHVPSPWSVYVILTFCTLRTTWTQI